MGRIVSSVFRAGDAATAVAMYHAACEMPKGGGAGRGRQGRSRRRSPTRSRTWTSRRRTGSACAPTTCRSAQTGKSSAARAWCRSSRRRVRCSGLWVPSCATRPRHGPARATSRRGRWPSCTTRRSGRAPRAVMTGTSLRRPTGRWLNPALSLPTEWSRPEISVDAGSWTRGPQGPLHQLSRHYQVIYLRER